MKAFLIFKTSVTTTEEVATLAPVLDQLVPQWNFDLHDCDKILRVEESGEVNVQIIEDVLKSNGFVCAELEG